MSSQVVGVVGIGKMGAGIVGNLVRGGKQVVAFDCACIAACVPRC